MKWSRGWRESCGQRKRMGEGRLEAGGGEKWRLSVLDMTRWIVW